MTSRVFRPAYVCGSGRIPFARTMTKYRHITSQELMTASLKFLISQARLQGKIIGDVAFGAVMKGASDWNLSRECVLGTELHPYTPAYDVQRACGTSLEISWQMVLKIMSGQIDTAIAGGLDTNSDLPIQFPRSFMNKMLDAQTASDGWHRALAFLALKVGDFKPIFPAVREPRTGLSMGEHCEKMVKEWKISREEQDEIALRSHMNAARAVEEGFFKGLVYDYQGLTTDTYIRKDTSMEKLAKLKPAFDRQAGTLTAGNSSPLTDGSATVLLASENGLKELNLEPWARFVDAQVAAVDFVHGEGLLMAPTKAVPALLARNQLKLQDFDFYEIHEAFAGQVACTLKAWESEEYCKKQLGLNAPLGSIDRSKINIKGSSIAVGHPFGATGARIVGTLGKLLRGTRGKRGLISICTAGGMGVTAILESV